MIALDEIRSRYAAYETYGGLIGERQSVEDVPRLLTAIDAVTKLHYQREEAEDVIPWSCMDGPCEHDDDCPEVSIRSCDECSTPEYLVDWPCPTVRAITESLALADPEGHALVQAIIDRKLNH